MNKSMLILVLIFSTLFLAPTLFAAQLTELQSHYVERWLAERDLNEWGDPMGTCYPGGCPLLDETNGIQQDRHDYLFARFPELKLAVAAMAVLRVLPEPFVEEVDAALSADEYLRVAELVDRLLQVGPAAVAKERARLVELARELRYRLLHQAQIHHDALHVALVLVERALSL